MKFTIETAALLGAVNRMAKVVERRNTIPILANIAISAGPFGLQLRATDLDIEITTKVAAEVAAGGDTTVTAGLLHDIARKLPKGSQVVVETDSKNENAIIVRCGRSRFTLHTLPIEDFPTMAVGETKTAFTLAASSLTAMFGKAQFAISSEQTRYYLNGVYFHTHRSGGSNAPVLRAVSTDGHRLAMIDQEAPETAYDMAGVIVPRKTVTLALALCEESDNVQIELREGKIAFTGGDTLLVSKLIDATFPDYHRVVPTQNNKIATFDRKDLMACVDRVSLVSSERGRSVKMVLSKGQAVFSMVNADAGSANEIIDGEYDSDDIEIGFNSQYINDMLSTMEGDTVKVSLGEPGSPGLFIDSKGTFSAVLMPMRV